MYPYATRLVGASPDDPATTLSITNRVFRYRATATTSPGTGLYDDATPARRISESPKSSSTCHPVTTSASSIDGARTSSTVAVRVCVAIV